MSTCGWKSIFSLASANSVDVLNNTGLSQTWQLAELAQDMLLVDWGVKTVECNTLC